MNFEELSLISIFFGIVSIVTKKYFELPFWIFVITYIIILCTFFYIRNNRNNQVDYKNPHKVTLEEKIESKKTKKNKKKGKIK